MKPANTLSLSAIYFFLTIPSAFSQPSLSDDPKYEIRQGPTVDNKPIVDVGGNGPAQDDLPQQIRERLFDRSSPPENIDYSTRNISMGFDAPLDEAIKAFFISSDSFMEEKLNSSDYNLYLTAKPEVLNASKLKSDMQNYCLLFLADSKGGLDIESALFQAREFEDIESADAKRIIDRYDLFLTSLTTSGAITASEYLNYIHERISVNEPNWEMISKQNPSIFHSRHLELCNNL